ncbi:MAG: Flp family type IVb pilin [Rhodospirillales bacterium]|nr:MAG: Flp family type IVb pilin [Rhodospirillales bacterium]
MFPLPNPFFFVPSIAQERGETQACKCHSSNESGGVRPHKNPQVGVATGCGRLARRIGSGASEPQAESLVRLIKIYQDVIRNDRGATAIEYGLIVLAIALGVVGIVFGIGQDLVGFFTVIDETLSNR